jgi:hypothetical protein
VELVLEVADIIDELNTITRLLEVQHDTLERVSITVKRALSAGNPHPSWRKFATELGRLSTHTIRDYITQIRRLMKDAQRTHQSVSP